MLNLKRFSKVSFGVKLQFGLSSSPQSKTLGYRRLVHTNPPSTTRKFSFGKYIFGSIIFGFSTIIVYAKYDTKFRHWLKTNVNGSDDLLQLIFFESKSVHEQPDTVKPKSVLPTNTFIENVSKSTPPIVESKEPKTVAEKPNKPLDNGNDIERHSSNFREIEIEAAQLCKNVSDSYSDALNALKNYYELVNDTMNTVSQQSNSNSLEKLKKIGIEKDELLQKAKENTLKASKRLEQLQFLINHSKAKTTSEVKGSINNNITKLQKDIKTLETNFEIEKDNLLLFSKYNNQIISIRKQFSDELQTLFPHVRLEDQNMKLTDTEFNVFVDYITQKLLFHQNELFKQETIGEEQVNDAINALKNGSPDAIDKVLNIQVDKHRRKHLNNFFKESFVSKASGEEKFKQQLRLQTEVHMDHLKEAADLAEKEVDRRVRLEYSEKAEMEKLKYQEQVSIMIAVIHAINDALKEHTEKRDKLNKSVSLWTACQSLFTAITTDQNASKHELKPLQELVNNIKKAGENHKIIEELLNSIPEKVLTRGVYTEETLKDRFFSVEDKAFHMALVPDTNVKLFELVTSFIFTMFTFKSAVPIPEEELNNAPINVNELNNIDILQRARYWIEHDNYHQALRYMNLLKGGAKILANDWMTETREYLATQQAAYTLLAYASASLRSHIDVNKTST